MEEERREEEEDCGDVNARPPPTERDQGCENRHPKREARQEKLSHISSVAAQIFRVCDLLPSSKMDNCRRIDTKPEESSIFFSFLPSAPPLVIHFDFIRALLLLLFFLFHNLSGGGGGDIGTWQWRVRARAINLPCSNIVYQNGQKNITNIILKFKDCFFLGGDFPASRLTFQSNSCYALSVSTDLLLSEIERNISFRVAAPVRKKNRNGPYSSLPYLIVAAAAVAIPLVFQYCNRLKNIF